MTRAIKHHAIIPEDFAGKRIDRVLAALFPEYSRSRLKTWLDKGEIKINNKVWRPKNKVSGGEKVNIVATLAELSFDAEAITLSIIHEDEDILVINKPIGLVVHPAAGHPNQTLLNALLHHAKTLAELPRAGIIHRLDKETSGLLVIAKTLEAHTHLVRQLKDKTIIRQYEAIVYGVLTGGGKIDIPIGRHPHFRTHQAVRESGKPAVTHYRILQKFHDFTHLLIQLETGRTHQIRVHMAYLSHPIVGDLTYGRLRLPKDVSSSLKETLQAFRHQALHAKKLMLTHPKTQKRMTFEAPLPKDFLDLLKVLKKENV